MKRKPEVWSVITWIFLALFALFLVYPMFGILKQSFFNSIAGAWVLNWETGEKETLCTITQADIDAYGLGE